MPRKKKDRSQNDIAKLESQITRQNPEIFKGIPSQQKRQIIQQLVSVEYQTLHQGPIPDPDTLAGYEDILPGSMDRIIKMAEKQSSHRMSLEKEIVGNATTESRRGQVFAFIFSLITIISATIIILYGFIWPGGILGTGGLAAVVYIFIQGKRSQMPNNIDAQNKNSIDQN